MNDNRQKRKKHRAHTEMISWQRMSVKIHRAICAMFQNRGCRTAILQSSIRGAFPELISSYAPCSDGNSGIGSYQSQTQYLGLEVRKIGSGDKTETCIHLCIHFMCWSEKSGDGTETCIHFVSTYEYYYHAVTDGDTMLGSGNKQEMRFLFISARTTGTSNNWKYSGNAFPLYFLFAITPPSVWRYCVWDW